MPDYPGSERRYHTRVGWWFMTRAERTQALLTMAVALCLLGADLGYVASRWNGFESHFAHGVELGLAINIAAFLVALMPLPSLPSPRERQRLAAAVPTAALLVSLWVLNRLNDFVAGLLGMVVALAVVFIVLSVRSIIRVNGAP